MGFHTVFFSSPDPPARVYGGLAITRWHLHLGGIPTPLSSTAPAPRPRDGIGGFSSSKRSSRAAFPWLGDVDRKSRVPRRATPSVTSCRTRHRFMSLTTWRASAMQSVEAARWIAAGITSKHRAPLAGQRFWDVEMDGKRLSLKSTAAENLRVGSLHISKLCEAAWIQDARSIKQYSGS